MDIFRIQLIAEPGECLVLLFMFSLPLVEGKFSDLSLSTLALLLGLLTSS